MVELWSVCESTCYDPRDCTIIGEIDCKSATELIPNNTGRAFDSATGILTMFDDSRLQLLDVLHEETGSGVDSALVHLLRFRDRRTGCIFDHANLHAKGRLLTLHGRSDAKPTSSLIGVWRNLRVCSKSS